MTKLNIISERNYQHWPSYHVVYEWEDILAQQGFNLVLQKNGLFNKAYRRINRILRNKAKSEFKVNGKEYNIRWVMNAGGYKEYAKINTIPIFLDFPVNMVNEITNATDKLPFFWVTCMDIYEKLKKTGANNAYFIPLSISDKYWTGVIPKKTVDVVQVGRKNPKLHEYMLKYCKKRPEIEYVYQSEDGQLAYISTIRGNLGKFDHREEYLQLLSSSRISLVSSPGKDSSRDFGGIDFITPRFYESAVYYCHMIGRYTKNKESRYIGINKVCPCVENYTEFETILEHYLNKKLFDEKELFDEFIKMNVTTERGKSIMKIIRKYS